MYLDTTIAEEQIVELYVGQCRGLQLATMTNSFLFAYILVHFAPVLDLAVTAAITDLIAPRAPLQIAALP